MGCAELRKQLSRSFFLWCLSAVTPSPVVLLLEEVFQEFCSFVFIKCRQDFSQIHLTTGMRLSPGMLAWRGFWVPENQVSPYPQCGTSYLVKALWFLAFLEF